MAESTAQRTRGARQPLTIRGKSVSSVGRSLPKKTTKRVRGRRTAGRNNVHQMQETAHHMRCPEHRSNEGPIIQDYSNPIGNPPSPPPIAPPMAPPTLPPTPPTELPTPSPPPVPSPSPSRQQGGAKNHSIRYTVRMLQGSPACGRLLRLAICHRRHADDYCGKCPAESAAAVSRGKRCVAVGVVAFRISPTCPRESSTGILLVSNSEFINSRTRKTANCCVLLYYNDTTSDVSSHIIRN